MNNYMKNKKVLVGMLIFFLVILIAIVILLIAINNKRYNYGENSEYVYTIYVNNKEEVDLGISSLMKLENFKTLNNDKKAEKMLKLLKLYENDKKIKNIYYDKNQLMYTFQYFDGVLGGVMIKEFDPYLN